MNYQAATSRAKPLKDVNVRKALYQAIDIENIHKVVMRGQAQITGALVAPQVDGWTEGPPTPCLRPQGVRQTAGGGRIPQWV